MCVFPFQSSGKWGGSRAPRFGTFCNIEVSRTTRLQSDHLPPWFFWRSQKLRGCTLVSQSVSVFKGGRQKRPYQKPSQRPSARAERLARSGAILGRGPTKLNFSGPPTYLDPSSHYNRKASKERPFFAHQNASAKYMSVTAASWNCKNPLTWSQLFD